MRAFQIVSTNFRIARHSHYIFWPSFNRIIAQLKQYFWALLAEDNREVKLAVFTVMKFIFNTCSVFVQSTLEYNEYDTKTETGASLLAKR